MFYRDRSGTKGARAEGGGGGGGAGSGVGGSGGSSGSGGGGAKTPGCKERKLSVVPETSQASDDGSGSHDERVLEARDSLRDLFDGKPHGRVRSASEYVVLYPQSNKAEPGGSKDGRRRSSRFPLDRQPSLDTSISSATETSYISDSSWGTRLDSFGSGQDGGGGSGGGGESWPGVAKAAAVAAVAAKRASSSSSSGGGGGGDSGVLDPPPLSPTIARFRMRFFPGSSRSRKQSDCDSPTRPLPHTQLSRLIYSRSGSQDENYSSTDEDLLDDDTKVKQSLL